MPDTIGPPPLIAQSGGCRQWIIKNQLGRRNLTDEQKSYLRGQRYNREKRQDGGHGDQKSGDHHDPPIAHKLAEEYGVGAATIKRDGQFAAALDTLNEQVCPDIRDTVLTRQERGKEQVTKTQVTNAGKLIQKHKVQPWPFLHLAGWQHHHVVKAIALLATFPETEHSVLNTWLEQICLSATTGLKMLANLTRHTAEQRQHLYTLAHSQDSAEQSLAYTLAAKLEPCPAPQSEIVDTLICDLEAVRLEQRTWWEEYPQEPWSAELEEIDQDLAAIQDRLRAIAQRVDAAHQQWIAHHVEAFSRNVAMLQEHP